MTIQNTLKKADKNNRAVIKRKNHTKVELNLNKPISEDTKAKLNQEIYHSKHTVNK